MAFLADLMARIRIDGTQVAVANLQRVERSFERTGAAGRRMGQGVASGADMAGKALGSMGRAAAGMAAVGGVGLAAGLVAGGVAAFNAARGFEDLQARLVGITGSAQIAASKLKLVQEVAGPSPFTFEQLASASVALEAFGMRTEKVLPQLAKLGAAFGADEEHLQMLVRLYGQLAQGNFPDLESLTAFGLSRSQFAAQGIQFDGQGALLSSARDTLDALERIVESKYGGIMGVIATTTTAKLASVQDAWQRFLAVVGGGIATVAVPVLERLGKVMTAAVDSGVLARTVETLAGAVAGISGLTTDQGAMEFMAKALTFLQNVPSMMTFVKNMVGGIVSMMVEGMGAMVRTLGETLRAGAVKAVEGSNVLFQGLFAGLARIGDSFAGAQFGSTEIALRTGMGMIQAATPDMMAGYEANLRAMQEASRRGTGGLPASSGDWGNVGGQQGTESPVMRVLRAVEDNTRRSADALSLRAQTIGGGELARLGVSAAELSRSGGGGGDDWIFARRPVASEMERAQRNMIQRELARTGGRPRR